MNFKQFEKEARKSLKLNEERKKLHPDWPIFILKSSKNPDEILGEFVPCNSLLVSRGAYCKHCHNKHSNWWRMDEFIFPGSSADHFAVLCGECLQISQWYMSSGNNQDISESELVLIRRLPDFDLQMLISEIHDHGWPAAKALLPLIEATLEKTNDQH